MSGTSVSTTFALGGEAFATDHDWSETIKTMQGGFTFDPAAAGSGQSGTFALSTKTDADKGLLFGTNLALPGSAGAVPTTAQRLAVPLPTLPRSAAPTTSAPPSLFAPPRIPALGSGPAEPLQLASIIGRPSTGSGATINRAIAKPEANARTLVQALKAAKDVAGSTTAGTDRLGQALDRQVGTRLAQRAGSSIQTGGANPVEPAGATRIGTVKTAQGEVSYRIVRETDETFRITWTRTGALEPSVTFLKGSSLDEVETRFKADLQTIAFGADALSDLRESQLLNPIPLQSLRPAPRGPSSLGDTLKAGAFDGSTKFVQQFVSAAGGIGSALSNTRLAGLKDWADDVNARLDGSNKSQIWTRGADPNDLAFGFASGTTRAVGDTALSVIGAKVSAPAVNGARVQVQKVGRTLTPPLGPPTPTAGGNLPSTTRKPSGVEQFLNNRTVTKKASREIRKAVRATTFDPVGAGTRLPQTTTAADAARGSTLKRQTTPKALQPLTQAALGVGGAIMDKVVRPIGKAVIEPADKAITDLAEPLVGLASDIKLTGQFVAQTPVVKPVLDTYKTAAGAGGAVWNYLGEKFKPAIDLTTGLVRNGGPATAGGAGLGIGLGSVTDQVQFGRFRLGEPRNASEEYLRRSLNLNPQMTVNYAFAGDPDGLNASLATYGKGTFNLFPRAYVPGQVGQPPELKFTQEGFNVRSTDVLTGPSVGGFAQIGNGSNLRTSVQAQFTGGRVEPSFINFGIKKSEPILSSGKQGSLGAFILYNSLAVGPAKVTGGNIFGLGSAETGIGLSGASASLTPVGPRAFLSVSSSSSYKPPSSPPSQTVSRKMSDLQQAKQIEAMLDATRAIIPNATGVPLDGGASPSPLPQSSRAVGGSPFLSGVGPQNGQWVGVKNGPQVFVFVPQDRPGRIAVQIGTLSGGGRATLDYPVTTPRAEITRMLSNPASSLRRAIDQANAAQRK